jgi:hypothetical protein
MVSEFTTIVESGSVTVDDLFDVLADERRRLALYCLDTRGGSVALAELAAEVARLERGIDEGESTRLPDEDVQPVYLDLYHAHVPKMEENGVVEYDPDTGTVGLRPVLEGLDVDALLSDIRG